MLPPQQTLEPWSVRQEREPHCAPQFLVRGTCDPYARCVWCISMITALSFSFQSCSTFLVLLVAVPSAAVGSETIVL